MRQCLVTSHMNMRGGVGGVVWSREGRRRSGNGRSYGCGVGMLNRRCGGGSPSRQ